MIHEMREGEGRAGRGEGGAAELHLAQPESVLTSILCTRSYVSDEPKAASAAACAARGLENTRRARDFVVAATSCACV